MIKVRSGQIAALFAFDVGYEVALEKIPQLVPAAPVQLLSRKKQTPTYLQYTKPPQSLSLGATDSLNNAPGQITATVFDFGAISIAYRWSFAAPEHKLDISMLPELSQRLYALNLEREAREHLQLLFNKIRPAISRPEVSDLVEDYYVFVIEQFTEQLKANELLTKHGVTLAQMLSFDMQPLSPKLHEEMLSQPVSYYDNDLVLMDWNAAFIYDSDYWDTMNVLELLNVELLEARYIDAQLDKRIGEYSGLIHQRTEWPIPLRTPYKKVIEDLAELRVESSLLSERVDNALKLIGDLYLAKIHTIASKRFYLPEWDLVISRKLDIVDDLYEVLTDRVKTAQGQALEVIIILLILFEIVLALFVRPH